MLAVDLAEDAYTRLWENILSTLDECILTDKYVPVPSVISRSSKIVRLGTPQYDRWWRDMIVAENSSDVTPGATTVKPKILVLLPHISPGKPTYYIDSEKATLCRFINDHTDKYDFILKFHPRQTVEEIREYMGV